MLVNPIMVGNFTFPLIARRWVGLYDSSDLKDLSNDEIVGA